jgi:hypothetical protein
MKTTLDLNHVLIVKNQKIIQIKKILDERGIFTKIYPAPKSVLKSCAPIISFCGEDKEIIKEILNQSAIGFNILKMDKDVVQELLKK